MLELHTDLNMMKVCPTNFKCDLDSDFISFYSHFQIARLDCHEKLSRTCAVN